MDARFTGKIMDATPELFSGGGTTSNVAVWPQLSLVSGIVRSGRFNVKQGYCLRRDSIYDFNNNLKNDWRCDQQPC